MLGRNEIKEGGNVYNSGYTPRWEKEPLDR
jgi:hypothetical protein